MSRILRRPMFRGGPVSSYGTGIASGLANGGRVGLDNGGWLPAWAKGADTRGYAIGSDLVNQSTTQPMDLTNLRNVMGANQNWLTQDVDKKIGSEQDGDIITVTKGDIFEEESEKQAEKQKKADERGISIETMEAIDRENLSAQGIKDAEQEKMIAGIYKEPEGNVNNNGKIIPPPAESYEINADDVRAQAELFKELLGEKSEEKIKSAQISDASDYALQFFRSTVGEGKGMKEAAGDVAGFALSKPSKTEGAKAAADKIEQTATVLAINDAISSKRSKESIDQLIAKSGLDLENKKKLVDYTQSLTKGFDMLSAYIADSKAISFPAKVQEGLRKAGLARLEVVTTTSTVMKDPDQFDFDPKEDVGKVFIETDTQTAYTLDAKGNRRYY